MGMIADIQYALKRARSERWIEEQLERYENELIKGVKSGVARPLSVPARLGNSIGGAGDPLTDAEWGRFQVERERLHAKYSQMLHKVHTP